MIFMPYSSVFILVHYHFCLSISLVSPSNRTVAFSDLLEELAIYRSIFKTVSLVNALLLLVSWPLNRISVVI